MINPASFLFLFWALWPKKYFRLAGGKAEQERYEQ
jgi:hypothetical protein